MAKLEHAITAWRRSWPELATLAIEYGMQPATFVEGTHFQSLLRTVAHQQLSMASGKAISGRLIEARINSPESFLAADPEVLTATGLSQSKIRTISGVASAIADGTFDPSQVAFLSSKDAVAAWSQFWGIGAWSAKMMLLFHDGRPDIFAHEDYGVRTAATRHLGFPEDDKERWELLRRKERKCSGYGSFATRVLWQSIEN